MEPAHTVDVDGAVVHPDTLQQVGGSGRSLTDERGLVDQIEYVAHFPAPLEITGSGLSQPVVAVSEKSLSALEISCRKPSFELDRPG